MPSQIAHADYKVFKAAGLDVSRTISVWPAGLPARRWDGQSRAEYFEGEVASFGIGADHDIRKAVVSLDGGAPVEFLDIEAGTPIFLALTNLGLGIHRMLVEAQVATEDGQFASSTAKIEIGIASPVAWSPGTTGFRGMVPMVTPVEPSLDELFEEKIRLSIAGPQGYAVKVCVQLLDAGGSELASELIMEASLPCGEDVWARHCGQFLRRWSSPWAYLTASSANLIIESEDLGSHLVSLRRDVRPVRLVWHTSGRTTQVRLIDEHQAKGRVVVAFYPFTHPCVPVTLISEQLHEGFEPAKPGGLFLLEYGDVQETLAVSIPQAADFSELAPEPDEQGFPRGADALQQTQAHLARWRSAGLAGPLASIRRERVVERLEQHFFKLLCGKEWVEAERAYEMSQKTANDLKLLALKTETSNSLSVLLSRDLAELRALDNEAQIDRFADMASRYGIADAVTARAAMMVCQRGGAGSALKIASICLIDASVRLALASGGPCTSTRR
ncbi:hypothetical protein LJR258_004610 [Rhizobium sp. LjRoot258]